jgi:enoyl-CoA hydratase
MNLWLQQARPIFEAAVAMEFLGFTGPELPTGIAAIKGKTKPQFPETSPV